MKFICPKYPRLAFYSKGTRYQFEAGIFDINEVPEEQRDAVIEALKKTDPSSGVMIEQEYFLPFECQWGCGKKFETKQAMFGHKSFHKTKEDIDALSWREGGAPKNDV